MTSLQFALLEGRRFGMNVYRGASETLPKDLAETILREKNDIAMNPMPGPSTRKAPCAYIRKTT